MKRKVNSAIASMFLFVFSKTSFVDSSGFANDRFNSYRFGGGNVTTNVGRTSSGA
jgi:hypothetical protein